MRATSTLVWALPALLGCNSLTGVSDLEPVDCLDCVDAATVDTGAVDTGKKDTAPDTAADTGAPDTLADTADTGKPCTIDTECDDGNECTVDICSGLLECRNTNVDKDGDGEGPVAGACGLDCSDDNKNVFSTQTEFFTSAYASVGGALSFDYNCDGNIETQYTGAYRCTLVGSSCTLTTAGWVGTPPACGRSGKWATGCIKSPFAGTCIPAQSDRVQGCR